MTKYKKYKKEVNIKIVSVIILPIMILLMFLHPIFSFDKKGSNSEPIILIHDVSPVYFKDLKEIISVINKYHYQNRTYLFLIVDHDNKYNLEKYPKFVTYLHKLEKEGYHIEFHAYNHIGYEFNCNKTVAEEKIRRSFKILKKCGFNPEKIRYFIPPRYKISKEAEMIFLSKNISIILKDKILEIRNNKIIEVSIVNREYTWYLPGSLLKLAENIAFIDYKISTLEGKRYFLSIHPKAVNYGAGLDFLNYFLNKTCDH